MCSQIFSRFSYIPHPIIFKPPEKLDSFSFHRFVARKYSVLIIKYYLVSGFTRLSHFSPIYFTKVTMFTNMVTVVSNRLIVKSVNTYELLRTVLFKPFYLFYIARSEHVSYLCCDDAVITLQGARVERNLFVSPNQLSSPR